MQIIISILKYNFINLQNIKFAFRYTPITSTNSPFFMNQIKTTFYIIISSRSYQDHIMCGVPPLPPTFRQKKNTNILLKSNFLIFFKKVLTSKFMQITASITSSREQISTFWDVWPICEVKVNMVKCPSYLFLSCSSQSKKIHCFKLNIQNYSD